nr:MAG TPA: protein of unknown function (DUF5361) [Caudoviricetes sp.]
MVMATMIATDEDSLICDLAQYYHVFDYRSMTVEFVATLAAGLPEDSRIMRKILKCNVSKSELMLAAIYDDLNTYLYSMTSNARHGINRPVSIAEKWLNITEQKENMAFDSVNSYEKAKQRILGGG